MARYKPYNLKQDKFIAVSYADQIVAGSFEHALNELVENELDLSVFEARYRNDHTGRMAYDPAVLLKIVIYGYYKGLVSSRKLEEACRRNVVFMALSADTWPHFTTIAAFVAELGNEIVELFRDVIREKFDSVPGRATYGRRMGTVEPVFGNIQNKGMRRFTLRGNTKVDMQWKLFTMVHNIEKIANYATG